MKSENKVLRERLFAKVWMPRESLLAYAFLRGVPYRHVEPVIHQDKMSESQRKYFFANKAASIIRVMYDTKWGDKETEEQRETRQRILEWFAVPEAPERAALRKSVYDTYMAKKAEMSAKYRAGRA